MGAALKTEEFLQLLESLLHIRDRSTFLLRGFGNEREPPLLLQALAAVRDELADVLPSAEGQRLAWCFRVVVFDRRQGQLLWCGGPEATGSRRTAGRLTPEEIRELLVQWNEAPSRLHGDRPVELDADRLLYVPLSKHGRNRQRVVGCLLWTETRGGLARSETARATLGRILQLACWQVLENPIVIKRLHAMVDEFREAARLEPPRRALGSALGLWAALDLANLHREQTLLLSTAADAAESACLSRHYRSWDRESGRSLVKEVEEWGGMTEIETAQLERLKSALGTSHGVH